MIKHAFFLVVATTVSLLFLAGPVGAVSSDDQDNPPLKILILGGTGFIGPWEVEAALARGHEVTLFNRGKTRPELFPDLEKLKGDRDPEKDAGLSALAGRQFDVVINVRDLAEWIIHMAEQNITGAFNGCGPDRMLTMREVVETARSETESDVTFTWLGTGFMETHPDIYFPIWTPYEGEYKGFHTFDNTRSIKGSLTFRPLSVTIADLLEQFDTLPEEKRLEVMERIPVPSEAEMIEAVKNPAE